MKYFLIWILCGVLSLPITFAAFKHPHSRGSMIMTVMAGPFSIIISSMAWMISDTECVANCKE